MAFDSSVTSGQIYFGLTAFMNVVGTEWVTAGVNEISVTTQYLENQLIEPDVLCTMILTRSKLGALRDIFRKLL